MPMDANLIFDSTRFSERTLLLILKKAEEWKITPAEAVAKLLDVLAEKDERRAA